MDKVLFSSNKDDWCTPQSIFDALDKEFHFTIDVAASDSNAKCENTILKKLTVLHILGMVLLFVIPHMDEML